MWPSSYELEFEASECDFLFLALIVSLCSSLWPTFCVFVKMCVCLCVSIGLRCDSRGDRWNDACGEVYSVVMHAVWVCHSLPPPHSSSRASTCFPIIHSFFYGRKESKVWQVNAVKASDNFYICVSPPSLKMRKSWPEIVACCPALPSRSRRMENSSEERRK